MNVCIKVKIRKFTQTLQDRRGYVGLDTRNVPAILHYNTMRGYK